MDEVVKNLPASAGDVRDISSIPGSGRFFGVENSNTLQCSWLENSMDRGAWQAIVHVARTHTHIQELTEHQIRHNASLKTVNQHSPPGSSFLCSWANFLASLNTTH